jgi:putative tricarboxylic transport membrane protein
MVAIISSLIEAAGILFSWPTIGWMVIGLLLGIIVGALPGVGASLGMAIALPLTLPLDGINALIFLIGIYGGAMYGGSISAILLNVPGTGGSAATTFDGYPMTRQGEAVTALTVGAVASSVGGTVSTLTLIALSPFIVEFVLAFQSPEYFVVAVLGLGMIAIVARSSIGKGLLSGLIGMLIGTVGIAPTRPVQRYTFGQLSLYNGVNFIAILIGLFAISEMIKLATEKGSISKKETDFSGSKLDGIKLVLTHPIKTAKSAWIGMSIGAIPGAGSSIANFISYAEGMRSADEPDTFGDGNPQGVIATEASNNGSIDGSLVPALAFGIPGSGATAVLIGGLIMHGLRPGPALFSDSLHITYTMYLSVLVGNIVIILVGVLVITRMSYITTINTRILIPMVTVLAFLGGFAIRNNWVDILTILAMGILGYYMVRSNYSIIALVLGAILGPIAEENLQRSLQLSGGSWDIFFTRPISLVMVIMLAMVLFGPVIGPRIRELVN